jgi:nucleoside-diphosphate-sugar epimerase
LSSSSAAQAADRRRWCRYLVVHPHKRCGSRDRSRGSHGDPGIYNVVDDEPAPVSTWLPALAEAVGAKPPYKVAVWLGKLAIGGSGVSMMTKIRGGSNAKTKRELGWQLDYPSWRCGFVEGLG